MLALHFLSSLGREMMFKLIECENDVNVTCDTVNSKLSCLHTQGPCGCFFFFFQNKDSHGDNKREKPSQMMSAAEDGSCRKQERLIMGGEAEGGFGFVFSRLHSSLVPLSEAAVQLQCLEEAGCTGDHLNPRFQHCSGFIYFILLSWVR